MIGDLVNALQDQPEAGQIAKVAKAEMLLAAGKTAHPNGGSVRAEVLREFAFGRCAICQLITFGIRLSKGTITGRLDLDGCSLSEPIVFAKVAIAPSEDPKQIPAITLCDTTQNNAVSIAQP